MKALNNHAAASREPCDPDTFADPVTLTREFETDMRRSSDFETVPASDFQTVDDASDFQGTRAYSDYREVLLSRLVVG